MSNMGFVTYQDGNVFYRVEGNGQPVVLLHGFGETGNIWDQWKKPLLNACQFIVPDLPGFGNSTLPKEKLTISSIARMIKAILDQEHCSHPLMIGHSMGGYVTLAFEEQYPDVLSGFGLFHSTAEADTEEKRVNRQKAIRFIEQNGSERFVEEFIPNLFASSFVKRNKPTVQSMTNTAKEMSASSLIASYQAMMERPSRKHVLESATKPLLFIGGREDSIVPYQDMLYQTVLPQKSCVQLLWNVAHMGMIENKKATQTAMVEYLDMLPHTL